MTTLHRQALDLISLDDWDAAHELIQDCKDELGCLIHAYLHREEGDLSNAHYWYDRAGHPVPDNSLEQEFERLLLLAQSN
jgi:hypothetical protein